MSERQRETELDRAFERRAKEAFDRSVREIDGKTRSRLADARRAALEQIDRRQSRPGWTWSLAPAGAVAASALVVAVLLWQNGTRPDLGPAAFQDIEILLGDEGLEIEMLDQEIEFYAWLEEQPELKSPAATDDGVG
jgi:hypothetical protein